MKLSAWHKQQGDSVEWYQPLLSGHMDVVYMSKVFSFTEGYPYYVDADKVIKCGSGYCISVVEGREIYDNSKDSELPYEIEHIYPDYSLYGVEDHAYGFLTRGCPRGCFFCHVKDKEGRKSYKVADLSEFWSGQSYIELLDPNTLACKDSEELLMQLAESKAKVEFNQGLDIRLMTDKNIELLNQINLVKPHFAWDRYEDKDKILPMFHKVSEKLKVKPRQISVFVLTNFDTNYEQDLDRVMELRKLGFCPYIMRYRKDTLPRGHYLNRLARWCNARYIFWKYETFEDYLKNETKGETLY